MSIDNGSSSTHGPAAEDGQWTVYLLIRTPKSATVELDTMNGPISLYDVDGKLTAHAHNGPISLRNFSGDGEISAVNGPISVEGSSGSLRIRTENGPINVDLRSEERRVGKEGRSRWSPDRKKKNQTCTRTRGNSYREVSRR